MGAAALLAGGVLLGLPPALFAELQPATSATDKKTAEIIAARGRVTTVLIQQFLPIIEPSG